MRCEFCGKEIDVWWARDGKWCCKDCRIDYDKMLLNN